MSMGFGTFEVILIGGVVFLLGAIPLGIAAWAWRKAYTEVPQTEQ